MDIGPAGFPILELGGIVRVTVWVWTTVCVWVIVCVRTVVIVVWVGCPGVETVTWDDDGEAGEGVVRRARVAVTVTV